jgi:hypothetical protein
MSIQKSTEMKRIGTRISTHRNALEELRQEQSALKRKILEEDQKLKKAQEAERKLREESVEPIVSEHALLRYMERVMCIDLDQIRKDILSEPILEYINKFGSGTFPDNKGRFRVKVKKRTVVTVEDF